METLRTLGTVTNSQQLKPVGEWRHNQSGEGVRNNRHLIPCVITHQYQLEDLLKYFYLLLKHLNESDTG